MRTLITNGTVVTADGSYTADEMLIPLLVVRPG